MSRDRGKHRNEIFEILMSEKEVIDWFRHLTRESPLVKDSLSLLSPVICIQKLPLAALTFALPLCDSIATPNSEWTTLMMNRIARSRALKSF